MEAAPLVDREHDRMPRRGQVGPDDVLELGAEVGITAALAGPPDRARTTCFWGWLRSTIALETSAICSRHKGAERLCHGPIIAQPRFPCDFFEWVNALET